MTPIEEYAVVSIKVDSKGRVLGYEPVMGGAGLTLAAARTYRTFMQPVVNETLVVAQRFHRGEQSWWSLTRPWSHPDG